jgi:hypothetical protein
MATTTFCPSCGAEYLAGVTVCSDCNVALGQRVPDGMAPVGTITDSVTESATTDSDSPTTYAAPAAPPVAPTADGPGDADEVVYDLSDWGQDDRSQLELLLTGEQLVHRWEVGSDLVVAEVDADAVEKLLDEIEGAGAVPPLPAAEDDDDGDDEATYAVMSNLFVAADRLQNDPTAAAAAGDFFLASDAAATTPPPFGIDRREWQQVQELAASLATAIESSDVDDDVIARDASALRGLLARYV